MLTNGVPELLEVCQLLMMCALFHPSLDHLHLMSLTLILILQLAMSVQLETHTVVRALVHLHACVCMNLQRGTIEDCTNWQDTFHVLPQLIHWVYCLLYEGPFGTMVQSADTLIDSLGSHFLYFLKLSNNLLQFSLLPLQPLFAVKQLPKLRQD